MSCSSRAISLAVVLGLSTAFGAPARAAWPAGGTPVTSDQMDQVFPVLAPSGDGGAVVAWQEFGRIFAQNLTPRGGVSPGWPADRGLEVCPRAPQGPYHQCAPRIAPDGDGGAFILWHDGRNSGCLDYCFDENRELYMQHITDEGTIDPLWPDLGLRVGSAFGEMVFTNGTARRKATAFNTEITPDHRGGVIIVWEERPPLSGDSVATIRAQRVSAGGRLLWGARGTLACIASGGHWYPVLWADGSGGAFVAWEEHPAQTGPVTIWGQHLSLGGRPLWGASGRQLVRGAAGNSDHQVSSGHMGEAFITWSASSDAGASVYGAHLAVRGRRHDVSSEVLAEGASSQPQPQVSADSRGGAWFTWLATASNGNQAALLRHLPGDLDVEAGQILAETLVLGATSAKKSAPRVAPDGRGGVFVAWLEGSFAPRATHVLRGGLVGRGWPLEGVHLDDPAARSYALEVISDDANGAIVGWQRRRDLPSSDDMVLLQRLREGGVGGEDGLQVASGKMTIPVRLSIALEGFTPNPIRETAEVVFTLAKAGPAQLELFDASGRRISRRDVGDLGSGRHVVRLSDKGGLPPGIYFVRLSRPGESITSRGVVIH